MSERLYFLGRDRGETLTMIRTRQESDLANEGIHLRSGTFVVAIPGYCPCCHYFNYLPVKNKDSKAICIDCKRKENG